MDSNTKQKTILTLLLTLLLILTRKNAVKYKAA